MAVFRSCNLIAHKCREVISLSTPSLFLIVSYAVCIMSTEYVGFFVTNAVFGMIYIFFFLERGLIRIVLTPLLLLGVIYGIVVFFLNYPLPSGILF